MNQLLRYLDLSWVWFHTSGLQNFRRINLWCLKCQFWVICSRSHWNIIIKEVIERLSSLSTDFMWRHTLFRASGISNESVNHFLWLKTFNAREWDLTVQRLVLTLGFGVLTSLIFQVRVLGLIPSPLCTYVRLSLNSTRYSDRSLEKETH